MGERLLLSSVAYVRVIAAFRIIRDVLSAVGFAIASLISIAVVTIFVRGHTSALTSLRNPAP